MLSRKSCMRSGVMASRAPNGSSMSSSDGRVTMARANAARCRMPPESSCGNASPNLARPTVPRMASASASSSGSSRSFSPADRWAFGPNRMFFLVVSHGNSIGVWNSMPRSGDGPLTDRPPTVTVPSSLSRAPATIRSRVDLPHPDGPSRQTSSPARTSRLIPARATVRRPPRRNVLPTEAITTSAPPWPPESGAFRAAPFTGSGMVTGPVTATSPAPSASARAPTGKRLLDEGDVDVLRDLRRGGSGREPSLRDQERAGQLVGLYDAAGWVVQGGTEPEQLLAGRDERVALRRRHKCCRLAGRHALHLRGCGQVFGRLRPGHVLATLHLGAHVVLYQRGVALNEAGRDRYHVEAGDAQLGDLLGVHQRMVALRDQIGSRSTVHVGGVDRTGQGGRTRGRLAGEADHLDLPGQVLQRQVTQ